MSTVPATYKAFVYKRYGKAEDVLELTTVPTEPLPASHVCIAVHSASLNPLDFKLMEVFGEVFTGGKPTDEKPYRVSLDASGVVVEVGGDVKDFKVGDEVFTMTPATAFGTLAEYVSVDAQFVALKPKTLSYTEAAAAALVSLTSYQALMVHGKVQAGERVLILGGTTSTGIAGIQYAKPVGAHVIATTSTKNVEFVKSLGADEVIDYTRAKWGEALAPHSVDVVFASVEFESWDGDAQTVLKKNTGRFVTLMAHGPPSAAKYGATFVPVFCAPSGEQLKTIAKMIDDGKLKVVVDSVFPFEKAVEGFTRLKTGRAVGKVVVQIK